MGFYFSSRFVVVDSSCNFHYFKSKLQAKAYAESLIGRAIGEKEDLDLALMQWGEAREVYTRFFEYEIVDLSIDPYHSYE